MVYRPGNESLRAETWADGLEIGFNGLRPSFDVDVMEAELEGVVERRFWDDWRNVHQPTLLLCVERGSIDPDEIQEMIEIRKEVPLKTINGVGWP